MNNFYKQPTNPFWLNVFAIDHPFAEEITYDSERESHTFTLRYGLGNGLPNHGKIEFWFTENEDFSQALKSAYQNQVVDYYKRQGDLERATKAESLLLQ